jgi:hypothetical protein
MTLPLRKELVASFKTMYGRNPTEQELSNIDRGYADAMKESVALEDAGLTDCQQRQVLLSEMPSMLRAILAENDIEATDVEVTRLSAEVADAIPFGGAEAGRIAIGRFIKSKRG